LRLVERSVIARYIIYSASNDRRSRERYAEWRRGWDSNPRLGFPNTRFPSVLLKPLGHLSRRNDKA
jgi:hypothetical protein